MGGDRVAEAMRLCPREWFLPEAARDRAGYDGPIDIGHLQTNSQPRTVADMLTLLDVQPGQRVLDVGSGSGWTTALLGHLVGPSGLVVGVERVPELAAWGAENLRRAGMPWTSIRDSEPGVLGVPEHGPYERILVSAMAGRLPPSLVDQLADGGVLVAPVAGRMTRAVRRGTEIGVEQHGAYRFVPLVE